MARSIGSTLADIKSARSGNKQAGARAASDFQAYKRGIGANKMAKAKTVVGKPKTKGSGGLRTKGGGGMTPNQKGTMTAGEKRMAKAGFKTGGKKGSPTLRQIMRAGKRGGGS
jgi:hypothetical protein